MKITKILAAGVVVALLTVIIGILTCGGVFNWVYQLEPTNVWKPMEGPPGPVYFIGELILSLIFVAVYAVINKGIPGQNKAIKGLAYGLIVFAVGMLPGMVSTYEFMTVNPVVVYYWSIWGLTVLPVKGLIAALIYGE